MKAKILVDTTLTVKAGQIVDVMDNEMPLLISLGRVEPAEEKEKKQTKKKAGK